jgi:hypothetical protein
MSSRTTLGLGAVVIAAALSATPAVGVPDSNQARAHKSAARCQRYWSRGDAAAREIARTAETTAVTISTEHEGSYTTVSPATLRATEPNIPITRREAEHSHQDAYVASASGTLNSYIVTVRALDGDIYSVRQTPEGEFIIEARVCGAKRHW